MSEIPKRLTPTYDTVRELYLKSGNRCAFPGCGHALFNAKGVFVGQICHIEAAEPGGERFNPNQTNEQRRQSSNLLLMCYDHHKETNDVSKFPVDQIRRIKEQHEKYFSDVVGTMLKTVMDHTTLTEPRYPHNLHRLFRVLGAQLSESESQESLQELLPVIKSFCKLPRPTRQYFQLLVQRGSSAGHYIDLEVSAGEVEQAANLTTEEAREYVSILMRHNFVSDVIEDDLGMPLICLPRLRSGWPAWQDLKTFCQKESLDLSLMMINLDFGILDEE